MAIAKWIGGALGWIISGNTLGALVGFYIGSLLDIALLVQINIEYMMNKIILTIQILSKESEIPFYFLCLSFPPTL